MILAVSMLHTARPGTVQVRERARVWARERASCVQSVAVSRVHAAGRAYPASAYVCTCLNAGCLPRDVLTLVYSTKESCTVHRAC
jgi:hypothetical protein